MENFVLYNNLFDIYGVTLTEKQQDIFKLYYRENLSMQEIADANNVSKSFVGKVIKEAENKLTQLEDVFHLLNYKERLYKLSLEDDLNKLKNEIKKVSDEI